MQIVERDLVDLTEGYYDGNEIIFKPHVPVARFLAWYCLGVCMLFWFLAALIPDTSIFAAALGGTAAAFHSVKIYRRRIVAAVTWEIRKTSR